MLVDAKGGTYWKFWEQFVKDHLLRLGLISESDMSLIKVTDDLDEAVEEVAGFYEVFHSYRYVGDRLVVRLMKRLEDKEVERIARDYSDLVSTGTMTQGSALKAEKNEPDLLELPRLTFRHRKGDFGRMREMIDAVNKAKTVD